MAEDAAAIARVHLQCWRETYSRMVEPGELDELDEPTRAARWSRILREGRAAVWVALVGDELIGFGASGAARDDDAERVRELEVEALYVVAAHHGSGAGQALLDAAIGAEPAFLHVAADNPRATRFYERNGFVLDGSRQSYPLVRTPIVSLRMVR